MDNDIILKLENVKKYFNPHANIIESLMKKSKEIKAVDDVSFELKRGKILGIIGESGSGKTTIGKLIMKLINPTSGNIIFENENINNFNKEETAKYRRNVQMIFQDPYASMNPRFKIKDVLKEPLYIHNIDGDEKVYDDMVIKALKDVKINPPEEFMERYPHMLSGGQRQRIATARALILNPKLVVADEPVSMIDLSTRAEILYMMKELQIEKNLSYIYITHDLSTARYFADMVAVMYLGNIVEIGDADEIIDNPKHPYTKALIAAVPDASSGRVNIIKELPIKGEIPNASDIPSGCRFHTRCIYAKEECKNNIPNAEKIAENHYVSCLFAK
ncbi:ABC transporter ATP-binding protein [Brachyspira hampsonii]|uniref:ABC transporter ATP-binding protein n=1 Tax=Brachyspira hampsonii TaxID=1287055 RepID=A0AAC9TX29_9SPIR|nr:ABC transporter ATP-binding protein [Brachyspira hampsonii]ASJ22652.1 ABC transporter ATP-binding protein [Brachyspira hampsonii]ELV04561.1 oligopeptide/dipeptide ABC transporter ATP-binding protein-like protein [Brachyspira hampsonii 30599]MBW5380616.1 ABC transporter ATP-binding protein [Brachyspira hampsonii]MBW5411182.1 ABC transporter ATP-binding protein [Brachyspira hampsonii]OEJ19347.1 oligopeptide ABC transporter ATP-binding protein [Brachyspira hampsonii]